MLASSLAAFSVPVAVIIALIPLHFSLKKGGEVSQICGEKSSENAEVPTNRKHYPL